MIEKKRAVRAIAALCALSLGVAACSTKEESGQLIGGVVGGVLGAVVGENVGGTGGAIIGGAIGAAAGVYVGGEIGAALDEEDRRLASQATEQAIFDSRARGGAPVTHGWESETNEGVSGSATARATPDPKAPRGPSSAPQPSRAPARGDDPQRATAVDDGPEAGDERVEVSAEAPRECYAVQEVAVIPGSGPVRQEVTYCREGDSFAPV